MNIVVCVVMCLLSETLGTGSKGVTSPPKVRMQVAGNLT